ncbi:MAG TPA: hypothetical protein PKN48_00010 [Bacteroidales bacterium]|nr:hypothetical protein [Bacteroidales bacterium]
MIKSVMQPLDLLVRLNSKESELIKRLDIKEITLLALKEKVAIFEKEFSLKEAEEILLEDIICEFSNLPENTDLTFVYQD